MMSKEEDHDHYDYDHDHYDLSSCPSSVVVLLFVVGVGRCAGVTEYIAWFRQYSNGVD